MVALNQRRSITAQELVPQLIVDDEYLLSFMRGVMAGVDTSIVERTLKPFVTVEGLRIGSLEPGKQFIVINGDWCGSTLDRKIEVMREVGEKFTVHGRVVPRFIVHVCLGYSTPYDPDDRRPLPAREKQWPAIVALGSTVDSRVMYATKPLVQDGQAYQLCAKSPWTLPTVFRQADLPEPDRLMESFWEGYKSAKFPAG